MKSPHRTIPVFRRRVALRSGLLLSVALAFPHGADSHGGGLNAEGCHHNRKTGDFHCHRAPALQRVPHPANAAASTPTPARPMPEAPKCHVGPRGGTYTITPSGRKNYGGC